MMIDPDTRITPTRIRTPQTWVHEKWNAEDLRPIGCNYSAFYDNGSGHNPIISLSINDGNSCIYQVACEGNMMATLWTKYPRKEGATIVGHITNSKDLFSAGITNDEEYDLAVGLGKLIVTSLPRFSFTDVRTGVTTQSDIYELDKAVNLGFRFVTKYLPK